MNARIVSPATAQSKPGGFDSRSASARLGIASAFMDSGSQDDMSKTGLARPRGKRGHVYGAVTAIGSAELALPDAR